MVFRMKTTLIIPDAVFHDLKRQAAKRGTTLSELATELLHKGLKEKPKPGRFPPLPSFQMGWPPKVNIADREGLYDLLDAAALMREHGVVEIRTADMGFHQFKFLRVVNPL